MTENLSARNCPNCKSTVATVLEEYSYNEWNVAACDSCSMLYLKNPPTYKDLEKTFGWETTFRKEDSRRAKKRGPIKHLARVIRELNYSLRSDDNVRYRRILGSGRILDVGCGDTVRWKPPFIPFGIEISKALALSANKKMHPLGGECRQGSGAETIWEFEKNYFDNIMMHSYLEHEINVSKILNGAYQCLKPGGKIFVRVPNFNSLNRRISKSNWPGMRYPDHVNYFTVRTLRSVANNAGFNFKLHNKHKIWVDDNIQALFIKPIKN